MSSSEQWLAATRLAILALLLAGSPPVGAGWDEARAAERSGDYAKAFAEYRKLADDGDIQALHNLGVMYYNGYGIYLDYGKALQCFLRAAEHGIAGSQTNLGYMYARGEGVPQDFVLAYMWFDIAAANGDSTGRENRAILHAKLSAAEIAEADRLAREWLRAHPPVHRPVVPPSRHDQDVTAYALLLPFCSADLLTLPASCPAPGLDASRGPCFDSPVFLAFDLHRFYPSMRTVPAAGCGAGARCRTVIGGCDSFQHAGGRRRTGKTANASASPAATGLRANASRMCDRRPVIG